MRAALDTRNEKLGFKIREAQLSKVPYMLVVGTGRWSLPRSGQGQRR